MAGKFTVQWNQFLIACKHGTALLLGPKYACVDIETYKEFIELKSLLKECRKALEVFADKKNWLFSIGAQRVWDDVNAQINHNVGKLPEEYANDLLKKLEGL